VLALEIKDLTQRLNGTAMDEPLPKRRRNDLLLGLTPVRHVIASVYAVYGKADRLEIAP